MATRSALLLAAWLTATVVQALPSFDAVKAAHRPSDFTLLDRHGAPIQTLRLDTQVRRLPWVGLEDMSPALRLAMVLSEDQRFFEHSGVDWQGVLASAWGNLWNTRTRGASTLTMQLAGLLDESLARPPGGRGIVQKIDQAWTARQLESRWRKSEILEAYLNSVPLRGELVGVNALAQTLFGKWPSGLDAQEAAITAALVRAPNARAEAVAQRACGVLQRQALPCNGVTALAETALVRRGRPLLGEQIAPHFARHFVQAQTARTAWPAAARSTLDAPLQRMALSALRQQLNELSGRRVEDGAVIVLDNASGEVLAWVGSSGPELSSADEVDGVLARRQPGSALKPFVYQLAFEKRFITPAGLLDDSPTQIATAGGLYQPQNYDGAYKGWVSARTALGASLNIPAVRVATLLGPQALHERLNALGLDLRESPGHYGHSLALGGAEVTLLALTNAYRSLALGGRYSPVRFTSPTMPASAFGPAAPGVQGTQDAQDTQDAAGGNLRRTAGPHRPAQVGEPASTFLVADILADNNARARTFGLNSSLATRGFAAVKTGTSKDMRDNWCLGFTDRYTVGVWVGNASGAAMHRVSGVSGAAPIWHALVQYLHASAPSRAPDAPGGTAQAQALFESQREPARTEWFLAGTEPIAQGRGRHPLGQAAAQHGASGTASPHHSFGIQSPRDGSIFALDPDMPAASQRIPFIGEAGQWVLDGKRIATGSSASWAPWPGKHVLVLLGPDGQPLQTVRFEVRGATLRAVQARDAKIRSIATSITMPQRL